MVRVTEERDMTDPNYFLAAWLAVVTTYLLSPVVAGIKSRDDAMTIIGAVFCLGTLLAALYCAGFVVVLP